MEKWGWSYTLYPLGLWYKNEKVGVVLYLIPPSAVINNCPTPLMLVEIQTSFYFFNQFCIVWMFHVQPFLFIAWVHLLNISAMYSYLLCLYTMSDHEVNNSVCQVISDLITRSFTSHSYGGPGLIVLY